MIQKTTPFTQCILLYTTPIPSHDTGRWKKVQWALDFMIRNHKIIPFTYLGNTHSRAIVLFRYCTGDSPENA